MSDNWCQPVVAQGPSAGPGRATTGLTRLVEHNRNVAYRDVGGRPIAALNHYFLYIQPDSAYRPHALRALRRDTELRSLARRQLSRFQASWKFSVGARRRVLRTGCLHARGGHNMAWLGGGDGGGLLWPSTPTDVTTRSRDEAKTAVKGEVGGRKMILDVALGIILTVVIMALPNGN